MDAEDRLIDLLALWEEAADAGRRLTAADLCQDTPHLADELRKRIEVVAWARKLGGLDRPALGPGDEPVRAYRLVRPLLRGGPGQVWRATTPDGVQVDLRLVSRDGPVTIRDPAHLLHLARHPNVVTTSWAWKTVDWVVVATEPADQTLLDRLTEVRARGERGVPRAELIEAVRDAAAGLDHLHATGAAQHRDIQPCTLVVCGTVVKVDGYGLVGPGVAVGRPGGPDTGYAAPELFAGATARHTDQFALAATYYHLRTGEVPFPVQQGSRHGRVVDLLRLPEGERRAVGRALSTRPGDRWPSCTAFAAALG